MSETEVIPVRLERRAPAAVAAPSLAKVGERLSRALVGIFADYGWQSFSAASGEPAAVPAKAWSEGLDPRTLLIRFDLSAPAAAAYLALPGAFVASLVDRLYGGDGQATSNRPLGRGERRLAAAIGERVGPLLTPVWAETLALTPTLSGICTPDDLDDGEDELIVLPLACGTAFALPRRTLDGAADQPPTRTDPHWRQRLEQAVHEAHLPVRVVVDRPVLPLERVLNFAPGDIIPVRLPALVPVTAGGRRIGHGAVGDANGRVAIKLETLEPLPR